MTDHTADKLYAVIRDALRGKIPDADLTAAARTAADAVNNHLADAQDSTSIVDHVRGPALVYVHTDGQTISAVDRAAVDAGHGRFNYARERAIAGALITEALRLLNESEPTP